jgi:hypothetical protein
LGRETVEVLPEAVGVDSGRVGERLDNSGSIDEPSTAKRGEFADTYAVARDDEAFSSIERAHHVATFVAELSLGDLSRHHLSVARVRHANQQAPPAPGVYGFLRRSIIDI